jgi:hypothetical protein
VFASYGLGTSEAATVTLVVAKSEVPGATRIGEGTYALGPPDWVAQIEARAVLAEGKLVVAPELLALRDHAMPEGAPGASLRITARLPFDARISLASTGIESAPSQLGLADVVDDFAIIVDADSADPGEKVTKSARSSPPRSAACSPPSPGSRPHVRSACRRAAGASSSRAAAGSARSSRSVRNTCSGSSIARTRCSANHRRHRRSSIVQPANRPLGHRHDPRR